MKSETRILHEAVPDYGKAARVQQNAEWHASFASFSKTKHQNDATTILVENVKILIRHQKADHQRA
jgi:hypothetical protein